MQKTPPVPPCRPTSRWLWALLVLLAGSLLVPAPAHAQREPERPEQAFAAAFQLYQEGLYEQAVQAFASFRRVYPDHINTPEALYYQAEASLALGRDEDAIALFTTFQDTYPVHPLAFQARLELGKHFFETGDYPRALQTLSQVLDETPPPDVAAKALYWMGESSRHLERFDEAIGYYQRAADAYPDTDVAPVALYAIAVTEIKRARYDAAARAFEVLAARYPNSTYAQNIGLALAEVYYELGDYRRAVDEIKRRLPNLSGEAEERALFLLAESYNQLRDSENAIVYYRRFTEGNPESPYYRRALFGLAWNYHFEGAYQWAADTFERVREGPADDLTAEATYYAAVNRYLSAQPREAIPLFEAVAERWPQHTLAPHALYELGLVYYELRRWEAANRAFSRLIRAYPEAELLGDAYYYQGNTFIALGRFDEALQSFDRAVALDAAPASLKEEVAFQKAWLLYRSGQYADAAAAFEQLYTRPSEGTRAADALFWAAESYYQTGALDRAERLFRRYLETYPDGKQREAAYYALGWVYFKQRRYEEAAGAFERFLADYDEASGSVPYLTDASLRLADSYYALKRYPEAIRIYSRLAAEGEDYALYQTAQAYSNAGETFEAITLFRRLLVEYPQSDYREEAQYSIGYLYFLNQDYDRAIEEYQSLIAEHPRDPLAAKAQYGIGDALFNAGRLEEAIEAYQQVLLRYPDSPFAADAAAGIQYALVALDDEARAEQIIQDFIDQHPDSPVVDELRFRLAEAKFQSGRLDEARQAFQSFIRSTTDERLLPEAYFYLGAIYADQGQDTESENYLRQLLDRYPQSPRRADAARRLGELYLRQERHQEALSAYQTLEQVAEQQDDAYLLAQARYGQSQALMELGRREEAERLLEEAIATAPESPQVIPARLGLARIYENTGRTDEALQLYREIVERSKDETGAEALFRLGALLLQQGEARAAVEEMSRMPVLYPAYTDWIAQAYLIQARAFSRLNQKGDAVQVYDLIIQQYPGTPYAEIATREKEAL